MISFFASLGCFSETEGVTDGITNAESVNRSSIPYLSCTLLSAGVEGSLISTNDFASEAAFYNIKISCKFATNKVTIL